MYMKHQFLKSALILSSVLAFMNCSEEAANALDNLDPAATQPTENDPSTVTAEESCYLFNAGQDLLIYPIGIVTDASGNVIGTFENGTITGIDGNPIAVNIDLNVLPLTSRQELNASTTPASSATASTQNPTSSANTTATTSSESSSVPGSSATVQNPTSSATVNPTSSDSKQESSSSQQQQTVGNITVTGSLTQTVAKGQTISPITFSPVNEKPKVGNDGQYWFLKFEYDQGSKKFTISGGEQFQYFPEKKISQQFTVDGQSFTLSLTLDEKATAQSSNSQQQAKSSSSQQQPKSSSSVRSSSSSAKSSSSVKSSSSQQQPKSSSSYSPQVSTNFKVKAGGRSGQGWGSRYWDCCMPHCAWSGNTSNPTKTCNAQMQEIGESGGSVCSGGSGGVCDMQAPWAANENLAFAFAAVPAGLGGECGKCFLLTFDGNTHNGGAGANTSGLRGKQMVIMVSNIGGDVQSNQFDIMIPGGGVGQFNGCGNQLGIASTGAQYGGFITDCKSDPSCVKQKCSVFSKYPKLQAGCEFSATWMGGANNPSFKFEELETCPSEISSKW
jgi:hypothetical protein